MSTVERKMQVRPKKGRAAPFFMGLLRFLVVAVTTYLGLLAVTFFIGRVIPIDPALAIAGDHAPQQILERLRREMHLDEPLYLQFYYYLVSALSGDFGTSVLTTNPVMDDIRRVFPATMELATVGTIIGAIFGVPFGVLAAVRRNSIIDQIVRVIGLVGYSVPVFWLAMVSLVIFYAKLNWVAYPGRIDIAYEYTFTPVTGFFLLDSAMQGQWDVFWDVFRHIILPASLLGYFSLAYISRMTRSFMLNELGQEYIVAARAKGLSETRVIWGHALRSAAVPLITVIALSYAGLLEGSVLTEIVFSWPGIGFYITSSLRNADMNAVLGGTIVVGTVFIGINLISDLLYRTLDPRTRRK
ncbi:peptide/nickel transport system permease protein [Rhizobium sp. ERR 922]|uniref:Peptide ABC transporter permease n=1 Tax=Rhizobium dioscoreae TaxID=2653122 RepID=A0ABQ0Z9Z3_9HYPH|nr:MULTISPECIES: ABC transporter permease [Rhizobium]MCZ3376172.1 ABC transporter permease [Rhizobium sp. AG207R]TWB11717.1 peptide/nickel transport system permease protein [Rhizobium sp. ERR1071]TWB51737.1 peptide/nickel transport system permease protein [Rhizobium sp. ERR 922]TWB94159.1 peptide/nickel transport system permease protein [Rhizobium sp. ERR 942]GES52368.1 peptide ABC transporter permease [Rhizobium dioscoreae]